MSMPDVLALIAVGLFLLGIVLMISYLTTERRARLRQAYREVGRVRRQSSYPADYFARDPASQERLRSFFRSHLEVPDKILGFDHESQLTIGDLSRLATLWHAFGDDANLCYGFVDDNKRHPFHPNSFRYSTIWVEFRYDGELWVYWYRDSAAIVDRRRDFYRRGAATILHDLRFRGAGCHLFKT